MARYTVTSPYEEEVRRLKTELYLARRAIIDLMPDEVGRLLGSYYSCESRHESYVWKDNVVDALIQRVDASTVSEFPWGERRAMCPLCNLGADSPYVEGFALPEGLRRHLLGWGNTHQCRVTEAAFKLARDHWNEKFSEAEELEWVAKQTAIEVRRKGETLYLVSPGVEPKLLDEGYSFHPPRTPESLSWAEARLISLGFQRSADGKVISWTDDRDDFVVFADPRSTGRLEFQVWKKPLPKNRKASSKLRFPQSSFHLLDSWKNDLQGKYVKRLNDAGIPIAK